MTKLLQDKRALVTGGSRGIGKDMVLAFAKQGADVAFTYRSNSEMAAAVAKEAEALGGKVIAIQSDASDFTAAETLIKEVVEAFGGIDILVNNAGITKDNLMLRMNEEMWDAVINVNLKSVFNLTKHVMRTMLKQRSGSIINVGSVVGIFGNAGQANYAASKAGIIGFSKSIAKEVGSRGIRCNVLAPGFIATDMTDELDEATIKAYEDSIPLKSLGQPQQVSDAAVFLGSDMSTYITGQVLSVCGGMSM